MAVVLIDSTKDVIIDNLSINNLDLFEFLQDKENKEEWITKSLIIGCLGLKQMIYANNLDYVEKEFNRFLSKAEKIFEEQSKCLDSRIDSTFNLQNKSSPLSQFSDKMDHTFNLSNVESPLYKIQQLIIDYFNEDNGKFKSAINHYFDEDDGQLKIMLDHIFDMTNKESAFSKLSEDIKEKSGKDQQFICDLLNPHKTDSPIELLKKEIFEKLKDMKEQDIKGLAVLVQELREKELKEIRDQIIKDQIRDEEKEKGTLKGREFEEEVYDKLEGLAHVYEDVIDHVGESSSKHGKKGDIIIKVNGDDKKKIVIECKNARYSSAKKVRTEMIEAMENRNACYGIFLFSTKDCIPSNLGPIKITDEYTITSNENENLYFAYRLARLHAMKEEIDQEKIDYAKISSELNKITEEIKNIDIMQREITKIQNSSSYLQDNLEKLKRNVDRNVNNIYAFFSENKSIAV